MRGRPKRAFSRAAVRWALRMALVAMAANVEREALAAAVGLDLVLDLGIKGRIDEGDEAAPPTGDELRRLTGGVEEQRLIGQGKIQRMVWRRSTFRSLDLITP